ncbi:hypothetical protein [Salinadaptatus halalkaliphilus]|uniref:hypothetical protein n=1 Tax=Salinadaptatus halalkaliphilus TaxID=2419781 RepID=UPI00157FDCA1|nr:hypothetical protein [Salinadaptatus halalkaliphilus]
MTNLQDTIDLLDEAEELLSEQNPGSREARAAAKIREARTRAERSREEVVRVLGADED